MFSLTPWKRRDGHRAESSTALATPRALDLMERMRQDFDQLFDRFFADLPAAWDELGRNWRWGLDVKETDDEVTIRAEAPGFEPDEFDLQFHDDHVVIRAQHKTEVKEKDREEFFEQDFYRTVPLPASVDPDKAEARYRNGVLTISFPKTERGKGKRIAIKG